MNSIARDVQQIGGYVALNWFHSLSWPYDPLYELWVDIGDRLEFFPFYRSSFRELEKNSLYRAWKRIGEDEHFQYLKMHRWIG